MYIFMQSASGYNQKVTILLKLIFLLFFSSLVHFESHSQQVDSSKFATVYFIRDKDLTNSAYVMRLKINDSKIIKLKNNSYHKLTVDTSEIKIAEVHMHLFSTLNGMKLYPGQTYYFKYFRLKDGKIRLRGGVIRLGGEILTLPYLTYSEYDICLLQVSDSVGQNSIGLIDLNEKLKAKLKQKSKEEFVKVKRNAVAVDRSLSKDSSYIYFIRQNSFYAGGVPFKISISDSFSFLLPNNSMYIHATTASEVDIMSMNTNNNIQNTSLHITLEKGHAYYVYTRLSFENGISITPIRLNLIDRSTYQSRIRKKGKKTIIR